MTISGFDKSSPRMDIKVTVAKLRNDTFYKTADGRTMILSPSNCGGMKWTHDKSHVLSKGATEGYYLRETNNVEFNNIGIEWKQAALNLAQSGYLSLSRKELVADTLPVQPVEDILSTVIR
ncbi:hypothetical protein [Synechocystis sp. PCC 7509]|uniref:hypothetical protein n=1 Tax=Synechocystis sp. PCC 7509 TaxID=927677 RepID=UPI0002AC239B|nr:hypothetical protein [Synechocystis sp. PCC 7509]